MLINDSIFPEIIDFIRSLYPGRDSIPLHEPVFVGNEKQYLLDCIDSTYVSSVGKYVDRFEEIVRDYTKAGYAVAAVNGTSALHIALLLAGVQSGDLVITQPFTFVATCNAIKYCEADPVFVDVDKRTLGLSAVALEEWLSECAEVISNNRKNKIKSSDLMSRLSVPEYICVHKLSGRKISACVPMHTFGHPCEIDKIVEICNRYYIPVVEDAAEAIGSLYKSKHTGTFGLLGMLSFNGNKTITTGGGGMILTNDEKLAKLAKHLTTTAKLPHPWKFEHDLTGYNYRLPNLNAALGCAQMEQLDGFIASKRKIAMLYQEFFAKEGIEFITEPENCLSNYWLNAILLSDAEERDTFLKYSNENKVMTRPAWTLMPGLIMYKNSLAGDLSTAKEIAARLVNLPSSVRKI